MTWAPSRVVVTGGAGFLGSHLADRLLADGAEVICIDSLITGSRDNVSHLADNPALQPARRGRHALVERRRPGRRHPAFRVAGLACRLPAPPAGHTRGRHARHHERPSPRRGQASANAARVNERGVRRSARASATRDLLGQRQSDRSAQRLRRVEARLRDARHGIHERTRCRCPDRADLQHIRPAHA